jgi:tetrahydromethanopterin S-methyltransferase subunit F
MQATDIMIHVSNNLNIEQKQLVEEKLRAVEGVIAPRFNKDHLLLIYFNRDKTKSSVLLNTVKSIGYKAQLVGL